MKLLGLLIISSLSIPTAGCGVNRADTSSGRTPGFRIRSDFTVGLNADQGWAGAPNENVTIQADRPFRLRFAVERPAAPTAGQRFGLQYRRNRGDWTAVEAHDFPKPDAEIEVDFAKTEVGAPPAGWQLVADDATKMIVAADGEKRILRARAEQQPLIGLYQRLPWELNEFTLATEVRLPTENRRGAGLVFGDFEKRNYSRVLLDPAAGTVRVSRFVQGVESVIAERRANMVSDAWLELEAQHQPGQLQVKFGDDALEFTVSLGPDAPRSQVGFFVPERSTAEFRSFVIEGEPKTPRVSIVACPAYENGAATTALLRGSTADFQPGVAISLAPRTSPSSRAASHGEFEWALVVRRFADGAVTNEEGDTFEFRMVDGAGTPATARNPLLRLAIPSGHLGGTFVETPGRIGPWQAANGDLYFIMEPSETDNLFMMVKSTDHGRTWREVDGANRPATSDLESVDGRQVGDTIHLIHQVTRSTRYHSFRTSDHPTHPDTWHIRDERAASATAIAQAATLVVRSDGSMVTFYVGDTIHYSVRSASGAWSAKMIIDPGIAPNLAGPKAELGANDTVHLACYGMDGTIWYRRLLPDGTLTPRQQIASGVGATRAEFGAVLPLVFMPEKNTVVIVYQQADGRLWERRVVNDGPPSAPVLVANQAVVRDAVDAQQPGADAVLDGETVHVLFIDASTRSIFSTHDRGGWQPPKLQAGAILGSWVRGNVYTRKDGMKVYGYVYDAGSHGGSGMNRYGELVLNERRRE